MKPTDFLTERSDIAEKALEMDLDHEVQMARQQCYTAAKDAIRLHGLLRNVSEMEGLEGWMQSKLSKAQEYLASVADALEYEQIEDSEEAVAEVPGLEDDAFSESAANELYNSLLDETTTAGAIASTGNGFANGGPGTLKREGNYKKKKTEGKK